MPLALFDLDETLLAGDSDYLWGEYLVEKGVVDAKYYEESNRIFYEQYKQGTLDIYEFTRFAFKPLSEFPMQTLKSWREEFLHQKIKPIMTKKGQQRVQHHRESGDTIVIITATNHFITEPIAELYGVDKLLATQPEMVDGKYTGECSSPCFANFKLDRLREWCDASQQSMDNSVAYSDSRNDIPLLSAVTQAYAVDPDEALRDHAKRHQWPVISFRD